MTKHELFPDTHHDPSANLIFGFWVYLMTDSIMFATLFATYAVLGPAPAHLFDMTHVMEETLVLLVSTFTCALAMLSVDRNNKKKMLGYFAATFLLGAVFLSMVGSEFSHLIQTGNTWQQSAALSSYFTLVGTHGLHIAGGMLFMIVFIVQAVRWGNTAVVMRRLTCLKIFWFFSYFLWVFMFVLVYLMGASA